MLPNSFLLTPACDLSSTTVAVSPTSPRPPPPYRWLFSAGTNVILRGGVQRRGKREPECASITVVMTCRSICLDTRAYPVMQASHGATVPLSVIIFSVALLKTFPLFGIVLFLGENTYTPNTVTRVSIGLALPSRLDTPFANHAKELPLDRSSPATF